MNNYIKKIFHVGARCSRPGACNAPLRVLSCLLLVIFLSGCKINLSIFSEDEDDQVVAASGNFDCTTAGGDCMQQYVNAIEDCDGYGVNNNDTWGELPNCTAVEAEGSVTEVFAAIPDDGNQFEGWGNLCWVGSDFCVFTISGEDAASEDEGTIEASFGGEIIPTPVDAYTYNHLGQRQSKTVTVDSVTTTTYFVYDPEGHLIGEYDESGNTIREYVWLEGNLLAQYDYTESATEPAMNYYANDHLGTPVFMASRDPQQNYNLTTGPFGERYGEFKAAGITQNIRFPGQHYEEETGYNQNWHRDYDPSTGRYLQSDPIGLRGGINTFTYVRNNPVMWVDPWGLTDIIIGQGRGNGTYGSPVTVVNDAGETVFTGNGSGSPSDPATEPTVNPGTYDGQNTTMASKDKPGVYLTDGEIPATTNGQPSTGTGIFVHCGYSETNTGSDGCITIQPDQCDDFFDTMTPEQPVIVIVQ